MYKDRTRLLLAEDDENLGFLLVNYLENEGFDVKLCRDGEAALRAFLDQPFDLCLLDVMMPKKDGFTLAREIRATGRNTPVLFITARSQKEDKLKGYGAGADDYITKPFDEEELVWKIKAVLRRIPDEQQGEAMTKIQMGEYLFDVANLTLANKQSTRRITDKEREILNYLWINRNRVIKRQVMVKELWGKNDYFLGRSLDVFITKIRKYLKEDPTLKIENVFGVGFIFTVPEAGQSEPI